MLRPATLADAMTLWRIRNQPDVRAQSRTTERVAWDAHVAWLTRTLADPCRRLGVWEHQTQPAGYGRLDVDPCQQAEVSVAVDALYRHRGVAFGVLETLRVWARTAGCETLIADVRPENTASLILFLRAGYIPTDILRCQPVDLVRMARPVHDCRLCAEGVPLHTVGEGAISDGRRREVSDLHEVPCETGVALVECVR